MRRASTMIAALLLLGSATACGDQDGLAAASSEGPVKIRYGVAAAAPGVDQSPYTSLPVALGYWEEEGLDVEVMGFAGSGAVFQALDAGKIDVGQGPPGPLFGAVASGAEMKAFYDHVPRNFLMPQVPADSDIESAADMAGATIGVHSLEAGGVTLIKAMVAEAGLAPDDIDLVAIGKGAEAKQFILQGDVDVVELWDSAYVELGVPLRPIRDEYFESIGFHNAIASTTATVESRPEEMAGLARGIAKATAFAQENPEAAVQLHWQVYPESKPVGVDDDVALDSAVAVLEARNVNTAPLELGWGYSDDEIVQAHMQMLLDADVLPTRVSPQDIWTSELLEEINDFDADAVRQQAREWEAGS